MKCSLLYKCLILASATLLTASANFAIAKGEVNNFPLLDNPTVPVGFDAQGLQNLEDRIQQFVADGHTKGIATLLVKDGNVVNYTQAGIRRASDNAPIEQDTIYRIYSMTKPVTGVAMMILFERGLFSLGDPIAKFIPEFKDLQVVKSYSEDGSVELEPLQRQPTMQELMSHTAGFAYGLYGNDPSNRQFMKDQILAAPDLDTFIDKVAKVPLMAQPGKQWFYSAAVDIQGAIVERLSGMSFGEFLQKNLFQPLAMEDTGFFVPAAKYDRFSDVWGYHPETKEFQRVPFPEPKYNRLGDVSFKADIPRFESGGGGLLSTISDYARFCQMLANKGEFNGRRILSAESIKLMRTNVLRDDQRVSISGTLSDSESKALGFGLNFGTIKNTGDGGFKLGDGSYFWGGAAGTWFWIDPVNNLFFIGMIQRFPQGGPEIDFRGVSQELVYSALK